MNDTTMHDKSMTAAHLRVLQNKMRDRFRWNDVNRHAISINRGMQVLMINRATYEDLASHIRNAMYFASGCDWMNILHPTIHVLSVHFDKMVIWGNKDSGVLTIGKWQDVMDSIANTVSSIPEENVPNKEDFLVSEWDREPVANHYHGNDPLKPWRTTSCNDCNCKYYENIRTKVEKTIGTPFDGCAVCESAQAKKARTLVSDRISFSNSVFVNLNLSNNRIDDFITEARNLPNYRIDDRTRYE